jgi:hypothetical protein
MKNWTRRAGLPAVAAFAVVLSGCDLEVLNPGAIQDADLVTPELMPVLVAGVSAEYNDVQDSYAFDIARLSDELAGTGSYGSTQDYRTGFFTDQDAEGNWEQMHEAAWAADQAWQRLQQVLEGAANSSADAARLFVLRGHAFNRLGEAYCRVVFDIGPSEDRSVAFTKAKAAFQQALTIQPSGEWANAALMGIAQSEFLLAAVGAGSWATADAAAATAISTINDIGYSDDAIYAQGANSNLFWVETWNRAEVGVYRTLAQAMRDQSVTDGDPDPRVAYTRCGEWNDLASAYPDNIPGKVTPTGNCAGDGSGAHQGADGDHAHYRQDIYDSQGSDIPRASVAEMYMIRAEAALQGTPDYAAFIGFINDVRAHHGMDPLATPSAMGMLNNSDGDWSTGYTVDDLTDANAATAYAILDRERYANTWMQGKRLFDLERWDHPFLTSQGWITGSTSVNERVACWPMPRNECQLNPNLQGDPACG